MEGSGSSADLGGALIIIIRCDGFLPNYRILTLNSVGLNVYGIISGSFGTFEEELLRRQQYPTLSTQCTVIEISKILLHAFILGLNEGRMLVLLKVHRSIACFGNCVKMTGPLNYIRKR